METKDYFRDMREAVDKKPGINTPKNKTEVDKKSEPNESWTKKWEAEQEENNERFRNFQQSKK